MTEQNTRTTTVRTEPLETPRTAEGGFTDGKAAGPYGGGRSPAGAPEAEERAALAGEDTNAPRDSDGDGSSDGAGGGTGA